MRMQGLYRGFIGRKRAAVMRIERKKLFAITRMQAAYRGQVDRERARLKLAKYRLKTRAAVDIQLAWRAMQARQQFSVLRAAKEMREQQIASVKIQSWWRQYLAMRVVREMREAKDRYRLLCEWAATRIQAGARMWFAKRERHHLAVEREKFIAKQQMCATAIQRILRGKFARKRVAMMRYARHVQKQKEVWAAKFIQTRCRGWIARRLLERMRSEEEVRHDAAVWIQARWRARKGRLATHLLRQAKAEQQRVNAAIMVQKHWRAKQGRFSTFLLNQARHAEANAQELAAAKLQAIFRGRKGRQKAQNKQDEATMAKLRRRDLQNWSATYVQKMYRGKVRNVLGEGVLRPQRVVSLTCLCGCF